MDNIWLLLMVVVLWRVYIYARRYGGTERQAVAWSLISAALFPIGLIAFIVFGERHLSGQPRETQSSQSV